MKLKFLDVRNCHELLPPSCGLSLVKRLEECLKGINDNKDKLHGSIDALISQNKKTTNLTQGIKRLCNSPIEIAQNSNVANRIIHTQAIVRNWRQPAMLHTVQEYENRIVWKTIIPLQFLLKGWGDASSGHQCYIHTISHNMNQRKDFSDLKELREADSDSYYYVGITGRNWLFRLSEHIGEIHRGSGRKFHKAWRDSMGMTDVLFTSSLRNINLTYEDAMNWEEISVDKIANGGNCLNMIPGGFKGLKYLHKLRIIDRTEITLEERDKAIADFVQQHPRKGIPNPFIAELWKDDEYYLKVNEAKSKTLTAEQVRQIREMAKLGRTASDIAEVVGALNEIQVKNVISGKYYGRIH
jgi:hypothetical protein